MTGSATASQLPDFLFDHFDGNNARTSQTAPLREATPASACFVNILFAFIIRLGLKKPCKHGWLIPPQSNPHRHQCIGECENWAAHKRIWDVLWASAQRRLILSLWRMETLSEEVRLSLERLFWLQQTYYIILHNEVMQWPLVRASESFFIIQEPIVSPPSHCVKTEPARKQKFSRSEISNSHFPPKKHKRKLSGVDVFFL